jgi:hypothetical protein
MTAIRQPRKIRSGVLHKQLCIIARLISPVATNHRHRDVKSLTMTVKQLKNINSYAPVAQLDRVGGFEPLGREFESLRVHQQTKRG